MDRPGVAAVARPAAAARAAGSAAAAGGYCRARDCGGARDRTRRPRSSATAIGAHSVYVPEVRHPVEVRAAEEAHLVRWLAKRVGADLRAPALGGAGWKLMGGRLLPGPGRALPRRSSCTRTPPAAASPSTSARRPASTTPPSASSSATASAPSTGSTRPLAYALTGRLSRDELMALANTVYGQLEAQGAGAAPAGLAPRQSSGERSQRGTAPIDAPAAAHRSMIRLCSRRRLFRIARILSSRHTGAAD